MKVLIVLTYYRPHVSGLTIYAERLASGLARRGHTVTVLTSHYDRRTPARERVNGVEVVRVPVLFRVSKGVIMPTFGWIATRMVREHDVVSLHLPQFDAAGVALRGRWMGRPTVLTYQCDLSMPPGLLHGLANRVIDGMNLVAGRLAHRIVAHSDDFARNSTYLQRFPEKVEVIPPPIEMYRAPDTTVSAFQARLRIGHQRPVIGMAARLAAEKGVEVLLRALPLIRARYPDAQVVCAGPYRNVVGEREYAARLEPLLREAGDRWRFLDVLDDEEMPAFFSALDVLAVPSLNSTEAFGMVQVEAMQCGVPVVASDLPGVRQPVRQTGMGEVVPPGDVEALAGAVLRVLDGGSTYVRPRSIVDALFSTERTLTGYERLFEQLLRGAGAEP